MSERDRGVALAMLCEAFRVKLENMPAVRIRLYTEALKDVPAAVLEPMAQRVIKTRRPRWGDLPPVSELLEDAETCRQEMRAALKFQPCENCSKDGWTARIIDGVQRMVRCECWQAHQQRVLALGVGAEPIALPAGRVSDMEPVSE